jgi:hypothetical protein
MNVFYLDADPVAAAQAQCDKHVVKMLLETAQLLCTAHHEAVGPVPEAFYKRTHVNHPTAVWVRASRAHYEWTYEHFLALGEEYSFRYGRVHLTERKLGAALAGPPPAPTAHFWAPPQCMPDSYKRLGNTVEAYRAYYVGDKASFARWDKARPAPAWWPEEV